MAGAIALTGATGFLGGRLARALLAAGHPVAALVRADSPNLARLPAGVTPVPYAGACEPLIAPLRELGVEALIHAATCYRGEHAPADVGPIVDANLRFASEALEAACQAGARRLVNLGSTWQTYESEGYRPVNLYAASKEAFERIIDYYVDAEGVAAVSLRLTDLYGPDDPRRKLLGLLLDLPAGEALAMSPGEQQLDLLHVDDAVAAVRRALELTTTPGQHACYAVVSGQPLTLRALVAEVSRARGLELAIDWGGRPYRRREVMRPALHLPALPGWQPTIPLATGLAALARSTDV